MVHHLATMLLVGLGCMALFLLDVILADVLGNILMVVFRLVMAFVRLVVGGIAYVFGPRSP